MVKFLLQRPIAVLMAFTACFIVGLVTYFSLPVSLLPDIAIPQITIQVTGENSSARELENTVVTPVRRQLLQVAGLREIKSETRDGAGVIRLEFDFGVNTDLAFIEVNEKAVSGANKAYLICPVVRVLFLFIILILFFKCDKLKLLYKPVCLFWLANPKR